MKEKSSVLSDVFSFGALVAALPFLVTGNVGILDILPDFIAAWILMRAFRFPADVAPRFDTVKDAFGKVLILDAVKTASVLLLALTNDSGRGDVSATLSLIFCAADTLLWLRAVSALFDATSYLGERSDAAAFYKPFPLFGKSTLSVDLLQKATYIFIVLKNVLGTVPEFLRLSRSEDAVGADPIRYYPKTVLICFVAVTLFGFALMYAYVCYIHAVKKEGQFLNALASFVSENMEKALEEKQKDHRLHKAMWCLVIAVIFLCPFTPDALGGLPLFCPFLFPLVGLLCYRYGKPYATKTRGVALLGWSAFLTSLAYYVILAVFLETYSYESIRYFTEAKDQYLLVKISSAVQAVFQCAFAFSLCRFLVSYVQPMAYDGRMITEECTEERRVFRLRTYAIGCLATLTVGLTTVRAFLLGQVRTVLSNPNDLTSSYTVVSTAAPWLSTLTVLLSIALIWWVVDYKSSIFAMCEEEEADE